MANTWAQIEQLFVDNLDKLYDREEAIALYLMALEEILSIKKHQYTLLKNQNTTEDEENNILNILTDLRTGRPIQHILGKAYFYKNFFKVSEHTLIPRPETEELVDMIIRDHKDSSDLQIIDIGTGTGCIPISIAKALPQNNYTAVDVSPEALTIAKENATTLYPDLQFILADILEWDLVFPTDSRYDIIISNPPYITPKEKEEMHQNVLNFEPHLALFIEENAPLLFYDYIADFAKAHLTANGTLYFEINQYLGPETVELLRKKGFQSVELFRDINGADRMIKAKRM